MKRYISIARFFTLVNGTRSSVFQSSKAGDPLLPYLFVIVMEALSCLLKRVVIKGYFSGEGQGRCKGSNPSSVVY